MRVFHRFGEEVCCNESLRVATSRSLFSKFLSVSFGQASNLAVTDASPLDLASQQSSGFCGGNVLLFDERSHFWK
jgi:hypothetical protein